MPHGRAMATVTFEDVSKTYPDGTRAVSHLSLDVADGEFVVMVGPSGCGKSTTLRMLAGLEDVTSGKVRIGDDVVNDWLPKQRDISMVFQTHALYPHMSVQENLGFAMRVQRAPEPEARRRIRRTADMLAIGGLLDRRPRTLSVGERQRVAMGRAVVRQPRVFLMDEPLSSLDAGLRVQTRAEILALQRRLGVTTIYVTHDQVEAMTMGDRVAVMNAGHLQQVDTPQTLYDNPVNEFVAGFIGSPSINLVQAQLERSDGSFAVTFGEHRLAVDDQVARNRSGLEDYAGRAVILGIRPEDFEDASLDSDTPPDRRIKVGCELTEPLGSEVLVHFGTEATKIVSSAAAADAGEDADVSFGGEEDEEVSDRLVARVDPRSRIAEGEEVELAVDTRRLYFFDPETREAI
jgi:multiple sugar transport system ATP-binding protein